MSSLLLDSLRYRSVIASRQKRPKQIQEWWLELAIKSEQSDKMPPASDFGNYSRIIMKKTKRDFSNRHVGTYQLSSRENLVGELTLDGEGTILKVHAAEPFHGGDVQPVKGIAYTGDYITLIDCLISNHGARLSKDGSHRYHADIFPHNVAIGPTHLDPEASCVKAIKFTATDLQDLFYDFDAFSNVGDARPIIESVLAERRKIRPIQAGGNPIVSYFTGKSCVIEALSSIGKISVHHRPTTSLGGPAGVYIKNRMEVSIEPNEPAAFSKIIQCMYDVGCFLSVAAGRVQGIKHIQLDTSQLIDGIPVALSVFPSFPWKTGRKSINHKPRAADVPLDPIHAPDEFITVLTNWIERHESWHAARTRYLGCLRKGNNYDIDRLVAAANMFDILPADAVPSKNQLSPELAAAQRACREMFRKIPQGVDRDGVLGALGRMGQPSLPKKVIHRAKVVESVLGTKFPDLAFAASIAVKLRNYFVHDSSDGIDYEKVEPFLSFLTDTLEFVFAASDLIDVGWNTQRWLRRPLGSGHSFCRFLEGYDHQIGGLRIATMLDKQVAK